MRILFLISAVFWVVFIYFTNDFASRPRLGGAIGNLIEAEEMLTYTYIAWTAGFFSILFSIIGMIKVKRKGFKLLSIFSILLAAFTCFWVGVMYGDSGVDLDEIYLGLIGLGAVQVLLGLISVAMAKSK